MRHTLTDRVVQNRRSVGLAMWVCWLGNGGRSRVSRVGCWDRADTYGCGAESTVITQPCAAARAKCPQSFRLCGYPMGVRRMAVRWLERCSGAGMRMPMLRRGAETGPLGDVVLCRMVTLVVADT